MARDFDGSTGRLNVTATIPGVSGTGAFSISSWAQADGVVGIGNIFASGVAGVGYSVQLRQDAGDWSFFILDTVGNQLAAHVGGVSAGTWTHVGGTLESAIGNMILYTSGIARQTTNLPGTRQQNGDTQSIGVDGADANVQFWDGKLAEVALWNVELTAAEMLVLAAGYNPLFVRPASLQAYWPIIGNFSPEIDRRAAFNMTLTVSAPAFAHPRMIYPAAPMLVYKQAAAGVTVPERTKMGVGTKLYRPRLKDVLGVALVGAVLRNPLLTRRRLLGIFRR